MTFREYGFRAFYKHFTAFPVKDSLQSAIRDFPAAAYADYILTYGYIDPENGLCLEVLACARKTEKGFLFADGNDSIRSSIRISEVADDEFYYFEDENSRLANGFSEKIDMLRAYDVSEDVEKTRDMKYLDEFRDPYTVDDVLVMLTGDDMEPEECRVRITGLEEHCFLGVLLRDPDQVFGSYKGDSISFFIQEMENNEIALFSNLPSCRRFTSENLEDGSVLEAAVSAFLENRNEPNLIEILRILRDSVVWVPCSVVMSEEDQKRMEEFILSQKDDMDALIGHEFTTQGETRLVPDILQNGENYYFPVFSTREAMGDYGESFSKIPHLMPDVIRLARNNKMKPGSIILNAFTDAFVIVEELWEIIEKMDSRLLEG